MKCYDNDCYIESYTIKDICLNLCKGEPISIKFVPNLGEEKFTKMVQAAKTIDMNRLEISSNAIAVSAKTQHLNDVTVYCKGEFIAVKNIGNMLENIIFETVDLTGINTSNVESMAFAFYKAIGNRIIFGNTGWDNLSSLGSMFKSCEAKLEGLENIKVANREGQSVFAEAFWRYKGGPDSIVDISNFNFVEQHVRDIYDDKAGPAYGDNGPDTRDMFESVRIHRVVIGQSFLNCYSNVKAYVDMPFGYCNIDEIDITKFEAKDEYDETERVNLSKFICDIKNMCKTLDERDTKFIISGKQLVLKNSLERLGRPFEVVRS